MLSIHVGDKLMWTGGESNELLHVLKSKNGKFEARVNGSEFCLTGETANLLASGEFTKISDEEYKTKLDAFWASGKPKGERVEQ